MAARDPVVDGDMHHGGDEGATAPATSCLTVDSARPDARLSTLGVSLRLAIRPVNISVKSCRISARYRYRRPA
ncbi:hypothetical protein Pa4123_38760 [Phytohabitans aurantiacus]|uniref:Uncharacterized protein n=1 Tax=Phytohabitans aurantiacus TaxID=3016789 RepID=A0ABQ5QY83_9ACTN|nr:hypothetical protein Pa4123_38760 [Phytohabitans aurantiacus]